MTSIKTTTTIFAKQEQQARLGWIKQNYPYHIKERETLRRDMSFIFRQFSSFATTQQRLFSTQRLWSNASQQSTTIGRVHRIGYRRASTLAVLEDMVRAGKLEPDKAQKRVAKRLTRLQEALAGYDNAILFEVNKGKEKGEETSQNAEEESVEENIEKNEQPQQSQQPALEIPRGLYIHGKVGTGKTMLMDSFYEHASVDKKKRLHFHDFLSQIHARVHALKQEDLKSKGRNFQIDTSLANNPIHRVGLEFAAETCLLCLDEFQVTDIADALILKQLFEVLFQNGTVVVATSNRPPQDLYEGGLNRSYFLPFLDLLDYHCITHHIPSQQDYRRLVSNCSSFFLGQSENAETLISALAMELAAEEESLQRMSMELPVGFQRSIVVSRAYGNKDDNRPTMACFSFDELCDTEKGSADYHAIAKAFDIVVLEGIPKMDLDGHNRARRFITLIDELYEGKCALVCSTLDAKTPADLFEGSTSEQQQVEEENELPDVVMGIDVAQEGGTPVGALASVRELSFAFERSSSRIFEMCSRSWWDKVLKV